MRGLSKGRDKVFLWEKRIFLNGQSRRKTPTRHALHVAYSEQADDRNCCWRNGVCVDSLAFDSFFFDDDMEKEGRERVKEYSACGGQGPLFICPAIRFGRDGTVVSCVFRYNNVGYMLT